MAGQVPDMTELMRLMAESPRRDNSAYHEAMSEARRSFAAAQAAFDVPVRVRVKTRIKRNGDYVVKFTFKPARQETQGRAPED